MGSIKKNIIQTMLKDLKVAVIQSIVPQNYIKGEDKILRFVNTALFKTVDMVGLPEDCIASLDEIEKGYDPFVFLSSVAKKYETYLFGANLVKEKDGEIYTVGFLINRKGKVLIHQKKIVLTPPAINAGIKYGNTIETVDTEFGKMAILVCKDSFHRYSAWFFDKLMKANVDIVLVPSSSIMVSERSIDLWTDTLKTMSMLFNVFIVAPGTVGINPFDSSKSFGHALVISPQKVVLAEGSESKEEILYATLEKEDLERLRNPEAVKWQPRDVPKFKIKIP